jgi:hypothetical protein
MRFVTPDRPHVALAWVKSSLGDGGHFSRTVAENLDLSAGDVFVLDAVQHGMPDYSLGGITCTSEANDALAAFTGWAAERRIVVEDELAVRADQLREIDESDIAFSGDSVIRVTRSHGPVNGAVLQRMSHGFPRNMFVLGDTPSITAGEDIADKLSTISSSLEAVIVGAHDDEGYVVWKSSSGTRKEL